MGIMKDAQKFTPEQIRAKIRERLKAGTLPRNPPPATKLVPGGVVQQPHIQVGLVKGRPCSACDVDGPYVTYKYSDREIRFHQECQRIWDEEREKLTS